MKFFNLILIIIIGSTCTSFNSLNTMNNSSYNNLVPDAETAIKVAEAIWHPIYGDKIKRKKPFTAVLKEEIWEVKGTLHTQKGGVPYIKIQKSDCQILEVYHTK